MKYLLVLILGFTAQAHADAIGYGDKDCETASEKRALLYNKEICSLQVSCNHFPLNNPDAGVAVTKTVYCRPDSANTCLAPEACMADKTIAAADIPMVIPKFGGDDVAPVKTTGDASADKTCACEGDGKADRAGSKKRADGPAKKATTDTAPAARTETGRGVN